MKSGGAHSRVLVCVFLRRFSHNCQVQAQISATLSDFFKGKMVIKHTKRANNQFEQPLCFFGEATRPEDSRGMLCVGQTASTSRIIEAGEQDYIDTQYRVLCHCGAVQDTVLGAGCDGSNVFCDGSNIFWVALGLGHWTSQLVRKVAKTLAASGVVSFTTTTMYLLSTTGLPLQQKSSTQKACLQVSSAPPSDIDKWHAF
mmetsp:Transcript_20377/g.64096  ORF Transcript_20377/g.64096 Transcript_20377/m.64096 type:complete len:200 (+) Transcript_20377:916-1515(+)